MEGRTGEQGGRRRKKRAASIGVTRGYETRTASHMASPPSSTEPSIQFVPAKGMLHEAPDALSVSPPGSVGMLGAQRPSLQGEGREGGGVDGGTNTVREDRNNPQGSCAATGRTAAISDSGAVVSEALRAPDSNAGGSHLLASETESHLATHPSPFPSPPVRLTAHRYTCPIHTPIPVSPPPPLPPATHPPATHPPATPSNASTRPCCCNRRGQVKAEARTHQERALAARGQVFCEATQHRQCLLGARDKRARSWSAGQPKNKGGRRLGGRGSRLVAVPLSSTRRRPPCRFRTLTQWTRDLTFFDRYSAS